VCCFFIVVSIVAPTYPFIASNERAQVTFVVKRWKWERMKEENKKGGLGRGRLPPYLVGIVFLVAQRCNRC
jgi:hypothetical protein